MPKTDRESLVKMLREIRGESAPKIVKMLRRLETESEEAERCATRVGAAKAYLGFAIESTKMLNDIETGDDTSKPTQGGVTVLVMTPEGAKKEPSRDEMAAILDQVSASVRAERSSN